MELLQTGVKGPRLVLRVCHVVLSSHVLSQPSREHHITRKRDDIESERAVLPLMSVLSD